MKFFISLITTSLLFFSGSLLAGSHAKTIMLSTKGPGAGNPFWASVEAGAKDAAEAVSYTHLTLPTSYAV